MPAAENNPVDFQDALQGLENGDFSRLEPLFVPGPDGEPCQMIRWHQAGLFAGQGEAVAEALSCACFLGWTKAAEYFLSQGVPAPGGAKTGMNGFHWAANRGELEAVRLLIRWKAPMDDLNMYGGNVLEAVIWSAIHQPRPGQIPVIEELLGAGARLGDEPYPTGNAAIDALLRQYGAAG